MNRPLCIECNKNLASKSSSGGFYKKCERCRRTPEQREARKKRYRSRIRPWQTFKKDYCENEECKWDGPFLPTQLQVDHVDGNNKNHDPSNLMTLCANCHARKTWENMEYLPPPLRGGRNVVVDVETATI